MSAELEVIELKQRVAKLERTVAFLLERLQYMYVDKPEELSHADVAALVNSGKKIEAIKLYREKTGVSLVEAKKFVDEL